MFNISSQATIAPDATADTVRPAKKRNRRRRKAKSHKGESAKTSPKKGSPVKSIGETKKGSASKKQHDAPMTKKDLYFALDCEMVGIGPNGVDSAVGRVTIVNWEKEIVLDTFVQVPFPVTDYRTYVSGITPFDIGPGSTAIPFLEARAMVQTILTGKILIGHGLENDLKALGLSHPWCDIRDTATYAFYMREGMHPVTGEPLLVPRRLRDLAWQELRRSIQVPNAPHSPVEDALAALDLYKAVRNDWEQYLVKMTQQKEIEHQHRWQFFAASPPPSAQQQAIPHPMYATPTLQVPPEQHPIALAMDESQRSMPRDSDFNQVVVDFDAGRGTTPYMDSQSSWFRFGQRRPRVFNRMIATSIDETVSTQPSVDSFETEKQSVLPKQILSGEDLFSQTFSSMEGGTEEGRPEQLLMDRPLRKNKKNTDSLGCEEDVLESRFPVLESDDDPEVASFVQPSSEGYEPPRYFTPIDPEPTPKSTWFGLFRAKGASSTSPPPPEAAPSSQVEQSNQTETVRNTISRRASESAAVTPSFFRRFLQSNSFDDDDQYSPREDPHSQSLH